MHAGVYGISEHDHVELQRRRHDVESLLAYAIENQLFVTVNHLYSSLTGSRTRRFRHFCRAIFMEFKETVNGQILKRSNRLADDFARRTASLYRRQRFPRWRVSSHIHRSGRCFKC